MVKVGRITASILLIVVGGMLLADQLFASRSLALIAKWWPIGLVMWGLEWLWQSWYLKRSTHEWKLDWSGMVLAFAAALVVITVSQPQLFRDWIKGIQFDFSMMKVMSEGPGLKFEQPAQTYKLTAQSKQITIANDNGKVFVRSADVDELQVDATVIVTGLKNDEAQQVAKQSRIEVKESKAGQLSVSTKSGMPVSGRQQARMDVTVIIPNHLDLHVNVVNRNGDVEVQRVRGDVQVKTHNGDLRLQHIGGELNAESRNGDIDIKQVTRSAVANSQSGNITMNNVSGHATAITQNGEIQINEADASVRAETLNGDIMIESKQVRGKWNAQSLAGDAVIRFPEAANVTVSATNQFGDITSDFSMTRTNEKEGTILGTGEFPIHIEVNGDIRILAY
ncbi:DUF4097 family beta strand repeat-containing protein [Paenibacillus sp. 481]|uniref:DUF4097 family beta strand repeat-containing protein n=1 Tax=Paenibacillus sp. 481 TaxID=2835869 RepID=UPI001E570D1A|nr:DUF4097 family beta strand repeat-containing protein [Paenibacillus sp. 481]UHA74736.1 DUF4097 family beta strand repeat protein [Paenibacillus sp. 481]